MTKTETLWSVGMTNNRTHARLRLLVWAADLAEAEAKLAGTLLGEGCEYTHTNTKPEYDTSEYPMIKHLKREIEIR
jgi:hypothetical protein